MTVIQKIYIRTVIARVAHKNGISFEECRSSIQELIEQTWSTSDPTIKEQQLRLVGERRTPTPEEFILLLSSGRY